jgi:hypothetical protein
MCTPSFTLARRAAVSSKASADSDARVVRVVLRITGFTGRLLLAAKARLTFFASRALRNFDKGAVEGASLRILPRELAGSGDPEREPLDSVSRFDEMIGETRTSGSQRGARSCKSAAAINHPAV